MSDIKESYVDPITGLTEQKEDAFLDPIAKAYFSRQNNKSVDKYAGLSQVPTSTNIPLSEKWSYDKYGIKIYNDYANKQRADRQGFFDNAFNAAVNFIPQTALSVAELAGYAGAAIPNLYNVATNQATIDFSNPLSDYAKQLKESQPEMWKALGLDPAINWMQNPGESFDVNDSAFWANLVPDIATSLLGFGAVAKGASLITKGVGTSFSASKLNALNQIGKALKYEPVANGLTTAWLGVTEGGLNAKETYDKIYESALATYKDENKAKELATQGAKKSFLATALTSAALNYTSLAPIFGRKAENWVSPSNNFPKEFTKKAGETLEEYVDRMSKSTYSPSMMRTAKKALVEIPQEGLEETGGYFGGVWGEMDVAQTAKEEGKDLKGIKKSKSGNVFLDALADATSSKEGIGTFLTGALGGGLMTAGMQTAANYGKWAGSAENNAKVFNQQLKTINESIGEINSLNGSLKTLNTQGKYASVINNTTDPEQKKDLQNQMFVNLFYNHAVDGTVPVLENIVEEFYSKAKDSQKSNLSQATTNLSSENSVENTKKEIDSILNTSKKVYDNLIYNYGHVLDNSTPEKIGVLKDIFSNKTRIELLKNQTENYKEIEFSKSNTGNSNLDFAVNNELKKIQLEERLNVLKELNTNSDNFTESQKATLNLEQKSIENQIKELTNNNNKYKNLDSALIESKVNLYRPEIENTQKNYFNNVSNNLELAKLSEKYNNLNNEKIDSLLKEEAKKRKRFEADFKKVQEEFENNQKEQDYNDVFNQTSEELDVVDSEIKDKTDFEIGDKVPINSDSIGVVEDKINSKDLEQKIVGIEQQPIGEDVVLEGDIASKVTQDKADLEAFKQSQQRAEEALNEDSEAIQAAQDMVAEFILGIRKSLSESKSEDYIDSILGELAQFKKKTEAELANIKESLRDIICVIRDSNDNSRQVMSGLEVFVRNQQAYMDKMNRKLEQLTNNLLEDYLLPTNIVGNTIKDFKVEESINNVDSQLELKTFGKVHYSKNRYKPFNLGGDEKLKYYVYDSEENKSNSIVFNSEKLLPGTTVELVEDKLIGANPLNFGKNIVPVMNIKIVSDGVEVGNLQRIDSLFNELESNIKVLLRNRGGNGGVNTELTRIIHPNYIFNINDFTGKFGDFKLNLLGYIAYENNRKQCLKTITDYALKNPYETGVKELLYLINYINQYMDIADKINQKGTINVNIASKTTNQETRLNDTPIVPADPKAGEFYITQSLADNRKEANQALIKQLQEDMLKPYEQQQVRLVRLYQKESDGKTIIIRKGLTSSGEIKGEEIDFNNYTDSLKTYLTSNKFNNVTWAIESDNSLEFGKKDLVFISVNPVSTDKANRTMEYISDSVINLFENSISPNIPVRLPELNYLTPTAEKALLEKVKLINKNLDGLIYLSGKRNSFVLHYDQESKILSIKTNLNETSKPEFILADFSEYSENKNLNVNQLNKAVSTILNHIEAVNTSTSANAADNRVYNSVHISLLYGKQQSANYIKGLFEDSNLNIDVVPHFETIEQIDPISGEKNIARKLFLRSNPSITLNLKEAVPVQSIVETSKNQTVESTPVFTPSQATQTAIPTSIVENKATEEEDTFNSEYQNTIPENVEILEKEPKPVTPTINPSSNNIPTTPITEEEAYIKYKNLIDNLFSFKEYYKEKNTEITKKSLAKSTSEDYISFDKLYDFVISEESKLILPEFSSREIYTFINLCNYFAESNNNLVENVKKEFNEFLKGVKYKLTQDNKTNQLNLVNKYLQKDFFDLLYDRVLDKESNKILIDSNSSEVLANSEQSEASSLNPDLVSLQSSFDDGKSISVDFFKGFSRGIREVLSTIPNRERESLLGTFEFYAPAIAYNKLMQLVTGKDPNSILEHLYKIASGKTEENSQVVDFITNLLSRIEEKNKVSSNFKNQFVYGIASHKITMRYVNENDKTANSNNTELDFKKLLEKLFTLDYINKIKNKKSDDLRDTLIKDLNLHPDFSLFFSKAILDRLSQKLQDKSVQVNTIASILAPVAENYKPVFTNIDNKKIYNYILPNFITQTFGNIQNNEVEMIKKSPLIKNNKIEYTSKLIRDLILNTEEEQKRKYKLHYLDGYKNKGKIQELEKEDKLKLKLHLLNNPIEGEGVILFFPTLSDKSNLCLIERPRIFESNISLENIANNEHIKAVIATEFNRIKNIYYQTQAIKDGKGSGKLLEGYHPSDLKDLNSGSATIFHTIPELNKFLEVSDLSNFEDFYNKSEVQNAVNKFFVQVVNNLFNSSYAQNTEGLDKNVFNELVLTDFVTLFDISQLTFDVAQAGTKFTTSEDLNSNIKKASAEATKRLASLIAPGKPQVGKDFIKYLIVNDVKDKDLSALYKGILPEEKLKAYSKGEITSTDAMEFISLRQHLEVLAGKGYPLTKEFIEELVALDRSYLLDNEESFKSKAVKFLEKYSDNLKLTSFNIKNILKELNKVFTNKKYFPEGVIGTSEKPVYAGHADNGDYSIFQYIKTASFPLMTFTTKGTGWESTTKLFYSDNPKTSVDRIVFKSGQKLGIVKDMKDLSDFTSDKLSVEGYITELPKSNFKIQQAIPYDPYKDYATFGSQTMKILPNYMTKDNFEKYQNALIDLVKIKIKKLAEEIGLDLENPAITPENANKIVAKLRELISSRDYAINDYLGLQPYLTESGEIKTILSLNQFSDPKTFEYAFNSLINNNILNFKLPGRSFVQVASEGFFATIDGKAFENSQIIGTTFREFDENNNVKKEKIYINKGEALKHVRIEKGEVKASQIYIGISTVKAILGHYPSDDELENFRNAVSYRIPTSSLAMICPLEVVGFLPESYGDSVIISEGMLAQMNSDFDVDKLFIHFKNPESTDQLKNTENTLFDTMYNTLTDSKNLEKILDPNNTEVVDNWIKKNDTIIPKNPDNSFFSTSTQIAKHDQGSFAKSLTGLSAAFISLYHVFRQQLPNVEKKYKENPGFKVGEEYIYISDLNSQNNDKVINTVFGTTKTFSVDFKNLKSEDNNPKNMEVLTSLAVDNQKDPKLDKLGLDTETLKFAAYLLGEGFDYDYVLTYINKIKTIDKSFFDFVEAALTNKKNKINVNILYSKEIIKSFNNQNKSEALTTFCAFYLTTLNKANTLLGTKIIANLDIDGDFSFYSELSKLNSDLMRYPTTQNLATITYFPNYYGLPENIYSIFNNLVNSINRNVLPIFYNTKVILSPTTEDLYVDSETKRVKKTAHNSVKPSKEKRSPLKTVDNKTEKLEDILGVITKRVVADKLTKQFNIDLRYLRRNIEEAQKLDYNNPFLQRLRFENDEWVITPSPLYTNNDYYAGFKSLYDSNPELGKALIVYAYSNNLFSNYGAWGKYIPLSVKLDPKLNLHKLEEDIYKSLVEALNKDWLSDNFISSFSFERVRMRLVASNPKDYDVYLAKVNKSTTSNTSQATDSPKTTNPEINNHYVTTIKSLKKIQGFFNFITTKKGLTKLEEVINSNNPVIQQLLSILNSKSLEELSKFQILIDKNLEESANVQGNVMTFKNKNDIENLFHELTHLLLNTKNLNKQEIASILKVRNQIKENLLAQVDINELKTKYNNLYLVLFEMENLYKDEASLDSLLVEEFVAYISNLTKKEIKLLDSIKIGKLKTVSLWDQILKVFSDIFNFVFPSDMSLKDVWYNTALQTIQKSNDVSGINTNQATKYSLSKIINNVSWFSNLNNSNSQAYNPNKTSVDLLIESKEGLLKNFTKKLKTKDKTLKKLIQSKVLILERELEQLKEAQKEQSYDILLDSGIFSLQEVLKKVETFTATNPKIEDLEYLEYLIKSWDHVSLIKEDVENQEKATQDKLDKLLALVNLAKNNLYNLRKAHVEGTMQIVYGSEQELQQVKSSNVIYSFFSDCLNSTNAIVSSASYVIKKALFKAQQQHLNFQEKIKYNLALLDSYSKKSGMDLGKVNDLFVEYYNGKPTGNFVIEESPEYVIDRRKMLLTDGKSFLTWFNQNHIIDSDFEKTYKLIYNSNLKDLEEQLRVAQAEQSKEMISFLQGKIQDYKTYNNFDDYFVINNNQLQLKSKANPNNFSGFELFKAKLNNSNPVYISEKYQFIQNNAELKEFYNFMVSSLENFLDKLPEIIHSDGTVIPRNFIPELQKSVSDFNSIANSEYIKFALQHSLTSVSDWLGTDVYLDEKADIDPITGEIRDSVPITMLAKNINPQEKSYNFGRILNMFSAMAYTYEQKIAVEPIVTNMLEVLKKEKNVVETYDQAGKKAYKLKDGVPALYPNKDLQAVRQLENEINKVLYNKGKEPEGQTNVILDNNKKKYGNKLISNFDRLLSEASQYNLNFSKVADLLEELKKSPTSKYDEIIENIATLISNNIEGILLDLQNISGLNKFEVNQIKFRLDFLNRFNLSVNAYKSRPTKNFTASQATDIFSVFTSVLQLGLNLPVSIINSVVGITSNLNYAAGQTEFSIKDSVNALVKTITSNLFFTSKTSIKNRLLLKEFDVFSDFSKIHGTDDFSMNYNRIGTVSGLTDMLMYPQKITEYYNQQHLMLSVLESKMFNGKKITDLIKLEEVTLPNGKKDYNLVKDPNLLTEEGQEFISEISSTIKELSKSLHGNYDPDSPILVKNSAVGRLAMMYRAWIPTGLIRKFGVTRYDPILKRDTRGSYTSLGKIGYEYYLNNKNNVGVVGALGKSVFQVLSSLITGRLKKLSKSVNDVKEDVFDQADIANIRKLQFEFYMVLAALGIAWGLKQLLEKYKKSESKKDILLMKNLVTRFTDDLMFFYNPNSTGAILKDPLPAYRTLVNLNKMTNTLVAVTFGSEEDKIKTGEHKGESKSYRAISKVVPILNAFNTWDVYRSNDFSTME